MGADPVVMMIPDGMPMPHPLENVPMAPVAPVYVMPEADRHSPRNTSEINCWGVIVCWI